MFLQLFFKDLSEKQLAASKSDSVSLSLSNCKSPRLHEGQVFPRCVGNGLQLWMVGSWLM